MFCSLSAFIFTFFLFDFLCLFTLFVFVRLVAVKNDINGARARLIDLRPHHVCAARRETAFQRRVHPDAIQKDILSISPFIKRCRLICRLGAQKVNTPYHPISLPTPGSYPPDV